MFNKLIIFTTLLLFGCNYNPDVGKFIKFPTINISNSMTVLIDKIEYEGTKLDQVHKELISRQVKSDLANASNAIIYDYSNKFLQKSLKDPDLIVNIKIFPYETDDELSHYTPVNLITTSHSKRYSGKGRNTSSSSTYSNEQSQKLMKLPHNYGTFELKSVVNIYNRKDLSLVQSKSANIIKYYVSHDKRGYYPFYNNSFILDNLHEISGLIVNSILFSSKMKKRKIEDKYGKIFLSNIKEGLIQKELFILKYKLAFSLDFKEKSVYLYYLGLIHEIIGQPLIAYDYYEKSIQHDGSNNLSHLAIGDIDRNRKL